MGTTCQEIRDARPSEFLESDCVSSYVNIAFSTLLFSMFLHVLNKLVRNNRRALAGYTKNTVSIDVHIRILEGVILWCVIWGLYCYLDIDDAANDDVSAFAVVLDAVVYSMSAFFETVVLFLLCSSSIGVNAFKKSYMTSFAISLLLLLAFTLLGMYGKVTPVYVCVNMLIFFRYLITSILYVGGLLYSRKTAPNRQAITKYVSFIVPLSLCKGFGRLLMAYDVDAGFCIYDVARFVTYAVFPSVVYIALKRDSQYWTEDITRQENHNSTFFHATTKQELPNYADVVIPKTELYYMKKLDESLMGSLQLHVWRRKVVCVKVFQMDYLTRDNIVQFKFEANAMRKLRHENIVRFMGVVIDPPNMGIVMEYCSNGDLFGVLEKLRKKYDDNAREHDRSSFGSFKMGLTRTVSFRTPSQQLYQSLADTSSDASDGIVSGREGDYVRADSTDTIHSPLNAQPNRQKFFSPFTVMKQVARGMRYLHSEGQAHRDLKSLNILLNSDWDSKIADFGECINVGGHKSSFLASVAAGGNIGTPAWCAPEILNHDRVSQKSDVFSYGIMLWEIMTWMHPMIYLPQREMERQIMRKDKKDEQLMKAIGSVFGVAGMQVGGKGERKRSKGRGGGKKGAFPNYEEFRNERSNSEDAGRRRLQRQPDDPHGSSSGADKLRESLLSSSISTNLSSVDSEIWNSTDLPGREVDASVDGGLGWGQDDMRVGRMGKKKQDVVIKFNLEDEHHVRVLVAEKMYRPPLVHAPNARGLVDLMQRCWSQDPNLRPSFADIVSDLEAIGKENDDIDSQFPFETSNLVNYAADHIVSPLPPRPYSKNSVSNETPAVNVRARSSIGSSIKEMFGNSYATPRNSLIETGNAPEEMAISPNSQRIYGRG